MKKLLEFADESLRLSEEFPSHSVTAEIRLTSDTPLHTKSSNTKSQGTPTTPPWSAAPPAPPPSRRRRCSRDWRLAGTSFGRSGTSHRKREYEKLCRAVPADAGNRPSPMAFSLPPSSRPQSRASEIPLGDGRPQSSGGMPISMSPKPRPPIRPKPEGMHGNAIRSVEERFAALRASTALSPPASVDQDPLSMVRMPSASEYKTPQAASNDIPLSLRPSGPRPMPSSDSTSIPRLPPKPPKIPLDTSLAASMPGSQVQQYSPARDILQPRLSVQATANNRQEHRRDRRTKQLVCGVIVTPASKRIRLFHRPEHRP